MLTWQQLAYLADPALARCDIAAVNLACAEGLPGSERIDHEYCLRKLDEWARQARRFTERVMPRFYSGRCDYPDSEPRFRMQALITVLQRDLGVRFRPDKRDNAVPLEPADSFIHGVIQGEGGTCASLPVVYVAVGRRLGYPLMLATAKCHLFVRWDALPSGECFNVEASGEGVSFFSDDYYRTGRFAMSLEAIEACGHLRSLSPREELAHFLTQRGECWMQERVYREAVTAFAWANELDPRREQHLFMTWQALRVWHEQLRGRLPPRCFPQLDIGLPPQRFMQMPRELERQWMAEQVVERLLDNPEHERRWWGPLRRDPDKRPPDVPAQLKVDYCWDDVSTHTGVI